MQRKKLKKVNKFFKSYLITSTVKKTGIYLFRFQVSQECVLELALSFSLKPKAAHWQKYHCPGTLKCSA